MRVSVDRSHKSLTAELILCLCQDELEFGYIDSPHQRFPVVLDSPRDGNLEDFPYKQLLVRDTMNSSLQNDTPGR